MSKFTFNRAGNLVEIYQGDSLLCAIFADRFPDFVAAASGALESDARSRCKCPDHFSHMRSMPICPAYTSKIGTDDYCDTTLPDGTACAHERSCHGEPAP